MKKIVLIGASTGGPGHLKKILSSLGKDFDTPIVIAQHMNALFIESFVKQFDNELPNRVFLANSKHCLEPSNIYVCASHCGVTSERGSLHVQSINGVESFYNPSVDALFTSAVGLCQSFDVMAVLLTGIGHDGALGLSKLKIAGANCIAESHTSAVVYGMPKKAKEIDPQMHMMHLDEICKAIFEFGRR